MKFKVGNKVHSLVYERDGEIIYADNYDTMPYLVGFKGLEGHSGKSAPDYIKSEIKRKGYDNQCKWCSELMLEPVKEEKKMRNLDVIVNNKKLNGKAMCRACYMLKTGSDDGCNPFECCKCEFEDNEACYEFLNAEYKAPKIKLSKFEYDLLMNCLEAAVEDKEEKAKIKEWWVITGMKDKGYFKNIDVNQTIKDILENCEVEE